MEFKGVICYMDIFIREMFAVLRLYCNYCRYSLQRKQLMFVHIVYSSSRNGCVCERTFKLLVLPEVLLLRKNHGRPSFSGKNQCLRLQTHCLFRQIRLTQQYHVSPSVLIVVINCRLCFQSSMWWLCTSWHRSHLRQCGSWCCSPCAFSRPSSLRALDFS
jgi:hypothetical protein